MTSPHPPAQWTPPQPGLAPYAAVYPQPPAPPRRQTPTWLLLTCIGAGLLVFIAFVIAVNAASGPTQQASSPDVKVVGCAGHPSDGLFGTIEATTEVTNNGKRTASYQITVEFRSEDGKRFIGSQDVRADGIVPGQTVTPTARTTVSSTTAGTAFRCLISGVAKS